MKDEHRWYLETLDARGGIAFARNRAAGDTPVAIADDSVVYIAPPDFSAVPVANGAIALAASRGVFQRGYYIDGREVGFRSLEELVEFVRRCFIRGGGGDGTDGGSSTLPVPQAPNGEATERDRGTDVPFGPFDEEPSALHQAIDRFGGRYGEARNSSKESIVSAAWLWRDELGQFAPKDRADKESLEQSLARHDGAGSLARAAIALIVEVLGRMPRNANGSNEIELARWSLVADALAHAIGGNLWWYLSFGRYEEMLKLAIERQLGRRSDHDRALGEYLLSGYPADEPFAGTVLRDPLTLLAMLPLPARLTPMLERRATSSVYQALAAFIGQPTSIFSLGPRNDQQLALDVMLFASTCIAGAHIDSRRSIGFPSRYERLDSALVLRAHDGWQWLLDQMPKRAFHPAIEEHISSCATLKYFVPNATANPRAVGP